MESFEFGSRSSSATPGPTASTLSGWRHRWVPADWFATHASRRHLHRKRSVWVALPRSSPPAFVVDDEVVVSGRVFLPGQGRTLVVAVVTVS